jgi:CheY-like chemotaxis protein
MNAEAKTTALPGRAPRRVLVVDDEPLFLRSFVERLADVGRREHFVARGAPNGREALAVLEEGPVDLVVTDLMMPVMDGFQLIAELLNRRLQVPILALTASPSTHAQQALRRLGVFSFLSKPLHFDQLLAEVREELAAPRQAHLDGVDLAAFLQLLAMERARGILTVRAGDVVGRLVVAQGNLVGASAGDLEGLEAAFHLLAAGVPTLQFREQASIPVSTSSHPLMAVVLEALKRRDERHLPAGRPAEPPVEEFSFDIEVMTPTPQLEPSVPPVHTAALQLTLEAQEPRMNIERANQAIQKLQETLGVGLLATDIWFVEDGISIAGYNSQPVAVALFNRMTNLLTDSLAESGFPGLNKYYLLDLDTDKLVVVLPCGAIRAGMLVDKKKAQLGLLISVALPKFIAGLEAILA